MEQLHFISNKVLSVCGCGNSMFVITTPNIQNYVTLLSNGNSFVFDYSVRNKMGGTNLLQFIIEQLPVIPPDTYTPDLLAYIVPRVLELVYTAWDLRAFADDVWAEAVSGQPSAVSGQPQAESRKLNADNSLADSILRQWQANREATHGGHAGVVPPDWATHYAPRPTNPFPHPPFKWDNTRRAQLRADLDGLYGHLYGLSRDELAYILDTFPIVRRKDEARWREYRTKRLVLAAYDKSADSF